MLLHKLQKDFKERGLNRKSWGKRIWIKPLKVFKSLTWCWSSRGAVTENYTATLLTVSPRETEWKPSTNPLGDWVPKTNTAKLFPLLYSSSLYCLVFHFEFNWTIPLCHNLKEVILVIYTQPGRVSSQLHFISLFGLQHFVCVYVYVCIGTVLCYQSGRVDHSQIVAIKHGAPEGGEECHRQQRPSQLLHTQETCFSRSRATHTVFIQEG